jgi:hypothetical protein
VSAHLQRSEKSLTKMESVTIPVTKWEKKWIQPTQTAIAATLGNRPGNTMRPPANDYQLYQWVAGERVTIQPIQIPAGSLEELPLFRPVEKQPDIIAGINLDELTKNIKSE